MTRSKLENMLRQLYEMQGKINYLTGAIEQALRDEHEYGTPVPVKAFEDHWKSMGKPGDPATANLPMEYTIWGRNHGFIEPKALDADAIYAALRRTGWKVPSNLIVPFSKVRRRENYDGQTDVGKFIEPSPQADGHVEEPAKEPVNASPFDSVGDHQAYGDYRAAVHHSGPYYPFEVWKQMGRPRG